MNADQFFDLLQQEQIVSAIEQAELNTSGEIRLHVENYCKGDVLDRAAFVFGHLKMHHTQQRNGVLFYLAAKDKKFAIIGDKGINQLVPAGFWNEVNVAVLDHFTKGLYTDGLSKGIQMAGEKLKAFFPRQTDDVNELPNTISFE